MPFGKGSYHTEATKARMSEIARRDGRGTFPRTEELKKKHSASAKAAGVGIYPRTEEHRRHTSEAELGEKHWLFGKHHSEETRRKISQAVKKVWENLDYRKRAQEKSREATLKLWQDPNYREKVILATIRANSQRPTAPEKQVLDAIEQYHLPYKYTGDGSFIIHGICPDFTNTNNQKIVIEVFGNYFHSPEVLGNEWRRTELGRIMVYNSFGFRCLILWEESIQSASPEEIAQQIRKFGRRHK